jgi:N-acetylhexosamine 1-kinase
LDAENVAAEFDLPAEPEHVERVGLGHINDSYLVRCADGSRFLLQRINTSVFREPAKVMRNIKRVIEHLSSRYVGGRRVLRLIFTRSGLSFFSSDESHWRMYGYIEGTYVRRLAQSPDESFAAAKAFGNFQALLSDMNYELLYETIPGFHDTPARYSAFDQAAEADIAGRAIACRNELAIARSNDWIATLLTDAANDVPTRVAHNDAKISNVLIDETTHEPLCIVDLDTVMPGMSLFDFGDMARSMTSGCEEDEPDTRKIKFQLEMFRGLAAGYVSEMGELLTQAERELLAVAGPVITYEQGLRFLTDYLNGDTYYRIAYPDHNLRRTRAQFALLASMEEHRADVDRTLREI